MSDLLQPGAAGFVAGVLFPFRWLLDTFGAGKIGFAIGVVLWVILLWAMVWKILPAMKRGQDDE